MSRPLISFTLVTILILGFQNCGKNTAEMQDIELSQRMAFFNYPYTEKPEYYSEIFLFLDTQSTAQIKPYKISASLAASDGVPEEIDFQLQVLDLEGNTLCPSLTDTLAVGKSSIDHECIGLSSNSNVLVRIQGTRLGKSFVIEKQF